MTARQHARGTHADQHHVAVDVVAHPTQQRQLGGVVDAHGELHHGAARTHCAGPSHQVAAAAREVVKRKHQSTAVEAVGGNVVFDVDPAGARIEGLLQDPDAVGLVAVVTAALSCRSTAQQQLCCVIGDDGPYVIGRVEGVDSDLVQHLRMSFDARPQCSGIGFVARQTDHVAFHASASASRSVARAQWPSTSASMRPIRVGNAHRTTACSVFLSRDR